MMFRILAISLLMSASAFSMNKQTISAAAVEKTYKEVHDTYIFAHATIKHFTIFTPNSAATHIHLLKDASLSSKNYYLVRKITNNQQAQTIDINFSGSDELDTLNQRGTLTAQKAQAKFNKIVKTYNLHEKFPIQWLEEAVEKTK